MCVCVCIYIYIYYCSYHQIIVSQKTCNGKVVPEIPGRRLITSHPRRLVLQVTMLSMGEVLYFRPVCILYMKEDFYLVYLSFT